MQRVSQRAEPLPDIVSEARTVALFGGAYSNWLAVRAVVADARRRGVDEIWFLGDVGGFGPHPDRSIEALRELGVRSIQGNYDDSVGHSKEDCACGYTDPRDNHFAQLSYDYTLANTSTEGRAWLAAMPTAARIRVGEHTVHLCHGSPRRVNEFLWQSTTPAGFVGRLCDDWEAHTIACTHTGIHWARRLPDGRGVVNVGAVGRPANDGRREVWYALMRATDGRLVEEFVPVAYDWEQLARQMAAEGLPPEFVQTITTGWWTTCLEILPARERMSGQF
ncbi:MAG: metallophosphoesterase family protein [Myxococcales bacterium]|nr:metallophosphoesterase family protein [Myxococcales bacterium]